MEIGGGNLRHSLALGDRRPCCSAVVKQLKWQTVAGGGAREGARDESRGVQHPEPDIQRPNQSRGPPAHGEMARLSWFGLLVTYQVVYTRPQKKG